MKLGKLQILWLKNLREHPERQINCILGKGTPRSYQACCLGELHVCYYRMKGKPLPFIKDIITDGDSGRVLLTSYVKYGLVSELGQPINGDIMIDGVNYKHLAHANDAGVSWTKIADYIEANAEKVFTKSV